MCIRDRRNTKEAQDIIQKYNLECIFISLHDLRIIHFKEIIKWIFSHSARQEIKASVSFSKVGLQKLGYIFLYGLYNILTISQIKKQIDKTTSETRIYIYSVSYTHLNTVPTSCTMRRPISTCPSWRTAPTRPSRTTCSVHIRRQRRRINMEPAVLC